MPAGALEGELGIRPQMHLFTASRADAYQIHDGLPQHAEFPPEWGAHGLETPARPTSPGIVSGSCACGSMRFEIDGQPLRMHHCHCGRCRRARGAAHATNVIYRLEALRYTAGEEMLTDFDLPGARFFGTSFCRNCGGAMPRRSASRGVVVVPVSSLDSDPQIHPLAHQFVAAKAPWFDIHDGVPQYPGAAPGPARIHRLLRRRRRLLAIVVRHAEQRGVGLGALDVAEPITRLAGARIAVGGFDHHLQILAIPLLGGHADGPGISHRARRDGGFDTPSATV